MAELPRVPPTRARALNARAHWRSPQSRSSYPTNGEATTGQPQLSHNGGITPGGTTTGKVRNGGIKCGFMLGKWKRNACHISSLNEKIVFQVFEPPFWEPKCLQRLKQFSSHLDQKKDPSGNTWHPGAYRFCYPGARGDFCGCP